MKFKSRPEDFLVEEISTVKPKKTGDYLYVILKKTEWTTSRAIGVLARRLNISRSRIGFAGNKDKNAITSQVISIWQTKKEKLERIKIKDIELKPIGFGDERINLGNLVNNQFTIKLRGLTKKEIELFEKRLPIVKEGFPNYFGGQRFGANENSHLIGKCIIQGDFERGVRRLMGKNPGKNWKRLLDKIPVGKRMERSVLEHLVKVPTDYAGALRKIEKPTRRIFVHAYQSWIFNRALAELIESGEKVKFLDLELIFPNTKTTIPDNLPILGTELKLGQDKFSQSYQKVLKEEGLTLEDFSCKSMPELASEGSERPAFVKPGNLKVRKSNTTITLSFSLGKGSYATTFLSALFLKDIK